MIAIYARQSIDKKDSISIEGQIDQCKKEVDAAAYKTYVDKGYSGKNTERPEFRRMMEDIKRGNIDKVVVYRIDRISRAILDFGRIIETFKSYNVEFSSQTEKFDTSTPIGMAMLNIIMVFAQLERETIQQRIRDNYYARGERGFYMGGVPPLGYNKEPAYIHGKKTSMLVPDAERAILVAEIYDLYAYEALSLGQISRYLNEKGIAAARGGSWDSGKISRLLSNPVYVKGDAEIYTHYKNRGCKMSNDIEEYVGGNGCFLYGKRDSSSRKFTNVENHTLSLAPHQGIVDSITFLKCLQKLESNKQVRNAGKSKHTWLSGLLKCKYCGNAVKVSCVYNENVYMKCTGQVIRNDCKGLGGAVKARDIERLVEFQLFSLLKNKKTVFKKAAKLNLTAVNRYKIEIIKIEEQINNLVDQLAQGGKITMVYLNNKIEELDAKKAECESEIKKRKVECATEDTLHIFSILEQWPSLDLEDKKYIAGKIIDHIDITADRLEVYWRRAFDVLQ